MATKSWKKDKDYEIKDHHQEATNRIVERLEESIKWNKPLITANERPHNPITKTQYKGINAVNLICGGFDDGRFYTYNNIRELASKSEEPVHVKKGEKGIAVFKAVSFTKTKDGKEPTEADLANPSSLKTFFTMAYAGTVFNASQIQGLPPLENRVNKVVDHAEIEMMAVALTARTNLQFQHGSGGAFYSPSKHLVNMPHKEQFKGTEQYYSTLMHEMGHANGAALGRDLTGKFGDAKYAFEELVAELSSTFLGAEVGLPYNPSGHDNHVAYMQSWVKLLKEDKNVIFKAASKGSRSSEFNLNHLQEYKLELEQQKDFILNKVHQAHKEPEQKKTLTMSM